MSSPILAPVVALVLWSFVMWAWLYATRIPAIFKNKIAMDPAMTKAELNAQLPPSVRWKADNYNHLMEQPTLFYAVCFSLQFLGQGEHPVNIGFAWGYVSIRVLHTLVHSTFNDVRIRFFLFLLSSVFLVGLVTHAVLGMFRFSHHL